MSRENARVLAMLISSVAGATVGIIAAAWVGDHFGVVGLIELLCAGVVAIILVAMTGGKRPQRHPSRQVRQRQTQ